ncbi:P-type DNA transfer protein VirB5 [Massilia scottii]|uniref:P-type DNA transfer protein VirB5 n=1 Tax=Massilia scottii TaxID=3057166 RepID=UPI002796D78C|nr:P-type DNA transfer protein VirB5 [Massilia sp. CCM 9029]MDQ1829842.1 P-type DNA transfer protein VirB5 [Massilia sp. CCM 9029]
MKRIIASITFASLGLVSSAAQATGVPVFDGAAMANALNQLMAWQKQYEQMTTQFNKMEQQYKAVTGSRDLGNIWNGADLRGIVPQDMANVYSGIQAGGGLDAKAQLMRDAAKIYNCEGRSGKDLSNCQAYLNTNAQTQSFEANALDILNKRTTNIQNLQGQINGTVDVKAIADLQARIATESTQVANDTNRLMILKAMADTQHHAVEQALKEQELLNLSRTNSHADTFKYIQP